MWVGTRILLGVLIGPFLVLLVHPLSRAYFWGPLLHPGLGAEFQRSPWVISHRTAPPNDQRLDTAAYWVLQASHEWNSGRAVDEKSLNSVLQLVISSQKADPDNAFWHQCRAILLSRLGRTKEAVQAWQRGASATRWDDLQSARLAKIGAALRADFGGSMAWETAALYGQRNSSLLGQVRQYGMSTLGSRTADLSAYVQPRVHLIEHGKLVRDSARSLEGSRYGWSMIERASRSDTGPVSPRLALEQREELLQLIRRFRSASDARFVEDVQRDNDSWINIIDNPINEAHRANLMLMSVFTGSFGSSMVVLIALGGLFFGLGMLVERNHLIQKLFGPRIAPMLGVLLCVVVYLNTNLVLPALWAVGCWSIFALVPKNIRTLGDYSVTPWGRLGLALIGWPFMAAISLYCAGFWAPALHLSDALPGEWPYLLNSREMLGVGFILLGLVIFPAPLLCLTKRLLPCKFAGTLLREFGAALALTCLVMGSIGGVAVIAYDKQLNETLSRISSNEPGYHLSQ